jgi:putative DNA primase/helicase
MGPDIWLLNTPAGTVDLHSGELRPHRREDFCTKMTAVAPGGECPIWLAFLKRVTGDNAELEAFLQRFIGYSLTGATHEHQLVFAHGVGGNGKGTFLNTVTGIMCDYAATAPMETFTATGTERHPADLAMLRAARLVAAQETEEGRRWAESRVKAVTGGDPITARFMRQDFFTFVPQFKLFVAGNHKPGLRGVDEAMRRRMNLVPFGVVISANERDPQLADKLKTEWRGILQWMIAGCLEWQRLGLQSPAIVRVATDEYLAGEDAIGTWLEECCKTGSGYYTTTGELFKSWTAWAATAGEFVGSQKRFAQALLDRGFAPRRQGGTGRRGFDDITVLRNEQESPDMWEH